MGFEPTFFRADLNHRLDCDGTAVDGGLSRDK